MSLRSIILQQFCGYTLWYIKTLCTFILVLFDVCSQCPTWVSRFPGMLFRHFLNDFKVLLEWFWDCSSCPSYYWYHFRFYISSYFKIFSAPFLIIITLILPRSRTETVWFYTSTSNKRAARPKLYTKSLTGYLKLMYSRFTLVRISINL